MQNLILMIRFHQKILIIFLIKLIYLSNYFIMCVLFLLPLCFYLLFFWKHFRCVIFEKFFFTSCSHANSIISFDNLDFFAATFSACLICVSQSLNRISLWNLSTWGRSTSFTDSDTCHWMCSLIFFSSLSHSSLE